MAFVAYCKLVDCTLNQISPPQFDSSVHYVLVNTTNNSVVNTASGGPEAQLDVFLTSPIANQNAVLNALQTAVQAAETGTPGLSFIWLRL